MMMLYRQWIRPLHNDGPAGSQCDFACTVSLLMFSDTTLVVGHRKVRRPPLTNRGRGGACTFPSNHQRCLEEQKQPHCCRAAHAVPSIHKSAASCAAPGNPPCHFLIGLIDVVPATLCRSTARPSRSAAPLCRPTQDDAGRALLCSAESLSDSPVALESRLTPLSPAPPFPIAPLVHARRPKYSLCSACWESA